MSKATETKTCSVCGRVEDDTHKVRYCSKMQCYMCEKHKGQIYRYGKIIDPTQRTTADKNEYIIKDNYTELIIRNRKQEIKAIAIIDIDDIERCKTVKWTMNGNGYVEGNKKKYKLHRFILSYEGPLQIDHINRNPLDNRKENLRIVSQFVNAQNNGAAGISYDKKTNKWKAEFQYYGKYFFVGLFNEKEDAIEARKKSIMEAEKNKDTLLNEYNKKNKNHVTGVRPSPHGKWVANFCADGKVYHVGTFSTKEEAVKQREIAMSIYLNKKKSA